MLSETFSAEVSNPGHPVGIRSGVDEGATRPRRRGSEHGTTTPHRGSDPGPPARVDLRTLRAPKACKRCRQPKPREAFLLLDDPALKVIRHGSVRFWCADCLYERKHITRSVYRAYLDHVDGVDRDALRAQEREDRLVASMTETALRDPSYRRALLRAAENLDG